MTPAELAQALQYEAVAGRIVTPVRDVHRKVQMLVAGDPRATFGVGHLLPASTGEVLSGLRELSGAPVPADPSPGDRCVVDPSGLAAQAEAAAKRLRLACERGEKVMFGTGHPAGPIELYASLARAMAARGARVQRFAEAEPFDIDEGYGRGQIRFVHEVACLSTGGDLLHTHSPRPMEYLLDTGPMPHLVVGDHGFVGVALARGADAVALVDTNDPALVLAWTRGLPILPLMCDDNRPPISYTPLADFLIERL